MKRTARRRLGKSGLELSEEAIHLVRTAPAGTLAAYYLGAVPFVLALLFFWTDMSRGALADQHLAGGALGMALLFLWMKFWQAVFAGNLRAALAGEPAPSLSLSRGWRILVTQTALQPTGLFLLPLAAIATLPFGWLFAFYQNLTALADGEPYGLRALTKRAMRQAMFWPGQNHVALLVLSGFGLCVWLNWGMVCYLLPGLVKSLFGIESMFTRDAFSMLNTTFFAAITGLTYLSVDPILKALYVLRCFYGESLHSGEDLKAELRRFAPTGVVTAACIAFVFGLLGPLTGQAADRPEARHGAIQFLAFQCFQPSDLDETAVGVVCMSPSPSPRPSPLGRGRIISRQSAGPDASECSKDGRRGSLSPRERVRVRGKAGCVVHGACALQPVFQSAKVEVTENCSLAATAQTAEAVPTSASSPSTPLQRAVNETPAGQLAPGLSPPELDRTIQEVMQQRKYTWRLPRERVTQTEDSQQGIIARFLAKIGTWIKDELVKVMEWLGRWLAKLFRGQSPSTPSGFSFGWMAARQMLLYLLIAGVAVGLALLFYRIWRNRRQSAAVIESEPIQPMPDLTDENVGAEQLPEDGWTKLARELLARREWRLALRAFYLASLAHLAERNLITLAKFKSNRDYERELGRRGHAFPELLALFGDNVSVFERIWYGMHEINDSLVSQFAAKVESIKHGGNVQEGGSK